MPATFTDDGYGLVLDAAWEPDEDRHGEPVSADAFLTDTGEITWQET